MGKIYAAKINHMTNPMGFLMERTVFSWKVKDCRGKEQKWARIVVAEDASFEKTVCDTGEADLDSRGCKAQPENEALQQILLEGNRGYGCRRDHHVGDSVF